MEALEDKIVTQIIRPYKDLMTYTEAVEYMGKSESYFNAKRKEYHVTPTDGGYYYKSDLDNIKLGVVPGRKTA